MSVSPMSVVNTLVSDPPVKHATEALYCHRNTVIYRAKQIEELTGRLRSDPGTSCC
jgi:sugar diacid utilization regulator